MEVPANHSQLFPAINATLNGLASVLLLLGFVLIKQRRLLAHEKVMKAAFMASAAFLASYLYYHYNFDSYGFGGTGLARPIYFTILITHIILAVAILPFIFRILWLAHKMRQAEHARMARWVWPVWMYVSVTGVVIYFMLYVVYVPVPKEIAG
jgi:putative membrane protein